MLAALVLAVAVEAGLDRVAAGEDGLLRRRRLGLLCHAASVTADGRHAVDVLRGRGLDLRRLFAPEHGLRGQAAAGEPVTDGLDPQTGLPVVSLYGAATRPPAESLRGLDVLVVDLQDVGVRYYTYASTMLLALEAAREAGVDVVVLDRPNPRGGERMEGPLRDPEMARSLLSHAPGPLVHGLTLGEMARLAVSNAPARSKLAVIAMTGWRRAMTWPDTGRPWVPPSPNLQTAEAALAYPATCLLEATNVSEGRGTEAPFLLIGAPWLDVPALIERLASSPARAGFAFEPREFVPRRGPAAPTPRHEGQRCRGVRLGVDQPALARAHALGVELLCQLRRQPGFALRDEGQALDRLAGSRRLRLGLEAGRTAAEIVAEDEPGIVAFARERRSFLLYD